MESIIKSLSEPGAWVSGILFSLIAALIYKWFGLLPAQLRGFSRSRRLKSLRKVLAARENPLEATYAIGKANAHFVAFLLMCFFYLAALLVSEGLRRITIQSTLFGVLISSPIFILEIVWLYHDYFATRLIKEHGKLLKYRSRKNAS